MEPIKQNAPIVGCSILFILAAISFFSIARWVLATTDGLTVTVINVGGSLCLIAGLIGLLFICAVFVRQRAFESV